MKIIVFATLLGFVTLCSADTFQLISTAPFSYRVKNGSWSYRNSGELTLTKDHEVKIAAGEDSGTASIEVSFSGIAIERWELETGTRLKVLDLNASEGHNPDLELLDGSMTFVTVDSGAELTTVTKIVTFASTIDMGEIYFGSRQFPLHKPIPAAISRKKLRVRSRTISAEGCKMTFRVSNSTLSILCHFGTVRVWDHNDDLEATLTSNQRHVFSIQEET